MKRAPLSLAALSKSKIPKDSPRSQCAFTSKSKERGVPQRRCSIFSFSSAPTGTEASHILGNIKATCCNSVSTSRNLVSNAPISSPTRCISAILSSAFSLSRFNWLISAVTALRTAFNCSTSWMIARLSS